MARILIVEDEMLVAMFIEDTVSDLGHQVVGPAMRLETALDVAANEDFDFAILDINLAGKQSFPVADQLSRRGIPFMFASGYVQRGFRNLTRQRRSCKSRSRRSSSPKYWRGTLLERTRFYDRCQRGGDGP